MIGVFPVVVSLLAGIIAGANGCTLDEASKHACLVLGVDVGGALYAIGLAAGFSVATSPVGVAGPAVSLVWPMTRAFVRD